MNEVVKYESEDELFGPRTVTTVVRSDVFKLLTDPDDESGRYLAESGNIEFEYTDSVLKVNEDTYGDEGAMLPFLVEYLEEDYEGLFYHVSSETDYIGETNDKEGKYFNSKQIIFFDMDNVLVDFQSGLDRIPQETKVQYEDDGTGKPHYDDIPGLFMLKDHTPGALEAVNVLDASGRDELYILSTAPWGNPSAWTDKVLWVKKHLDSDRPGGIFYKRLILTHHKNMCIQPNAWLIDDRKAHGSELFGDHFIHFGSEKFPDWDSVLDFFIRYTVVGL